MSEQAAAYDVAPIVGPVPQQSGTWRLVRLALVLALLVGAVVQFRQPVERDLGTLLDGLSSGTVRSVTIEMPEAGATESDGLRITWQEPGLSGPLGVLDGPSSWLRYGRTAVTTYVYSRMDGGDLDNSAPVRDAARAAGATVLEVPYAPESGALVVNWWGVPALFGLIALIAAPQPRLATKWAWFWLAWANPLILIFFLVEPVPLWRTAPMPARVSRLTGGWAFLLSFLVTPLMRTVFPELGP